MNRKNASLAVAVSSTCFLTYLIFWSGHQYSIDGMVMFNYAKSLIFQHSWVISPPMHWNGQDISVSKWAIGMTFAYIPLLWLFSHTLFGNYAGYTTIPYDPKINFNSQLLQNNSYLSVSLLNPLITAITVGLLYLLSRELGLTKRQAVTVSFIFGLLSPAAVYAKFDFSQPLASLFIILAILLINRGLNHANLRLWIGAGFSMGLAILARNELLLVLCPVVILVIFLSRKLLKIQTDLYLSHILPSFLVPVVIMVAVNQYINYQRFQSWTALGYNLGNGFQINVISFGRALLGILLSPGRGLFIFFPFGLLAFLILPAMIKKTIYLLISGLLFSAIIFYSLWGEWSGGISWGPRFLIPFLPYCTLLGFMGYDWLQSHWRLPANIVLFITTLIGGIFTLQGLLFNFLGFYGDIHLTDAQIINGNYNFQLAFSPIFAGWNQLLKPLQYDIFWIQSAMRWNGNVRWVFVVILIAFAGAAFFWFYNLSHKPVVDDSGVIEKL
jgi:4-amino-4-deoxy-L-arabinose transferase-like glycosyltransferase